MSASTTAMTDWNIHKARETYNVERWGNGYFDINDDGHLSVKPGGLAAASTIDLYRLCQGLSQADISLPVLVRFPGILHQRVRALHEAFSQARGAAGFRGHYTSVYPIKVNQQRRVVEELMAPANGDVGLEAGSKPELMAVLGLSRQRGVIVCNGYKDREYVRLALIAKALGHRVYIVVEKQSELQLIMDESKKLDIRPSIGVRVRLASLGRGKWQNTGGEKAKFGLSAQQLLSVVERLTQESMLPALELLHVHMGSQIANIRDIQKGMREVSRYYAELRHMGANIDCVDVGGGLSIDYDGTRSRGDFSMNYSLQEYANNIVQSLAEICAENDLPHPNIFTESGRAMTAHHAVLVCDVIDHETAGEAVPAQPKEDEHPILTNLYSDLIALDGEENARSLLEAYHDAVHLLAEAQTLHTHGVIKLYQRAAAEQLYYAICRKVQSKLNPGVLSHRDVLDELNEKLADKYFCNISIFQSIPDVWAIDQIFPIVPLHRLNEEPVRRAVIEDITCDSDGRIDRYVDLAGVESSLPLHEFRRGERYLLGIFLVGAYQEILGDLHNLFGDTDSIHVITDENGDYKISEPIKGDTVDKVVGLVNFEPDELLNSYRMQISAADLSAQQQSEFLQELESGLTGYTYLED